MKPQYILAASKQVLKNKSYLVGFSTLIIMFFILFIILPVLLIPANSLKFQLSIFTLKDYILLGFLSTLSSLLITMQIFAYKKAKAIQLTKAAGSCAFLNAPSLQGGVVYKDDTITPTAKLDEIISKLL